jgi:hypothetical protein
MNELIIPAIDKYRAELGISERQFFIRAGLDQAEWCNVKADRRKLSEKFLRRLGNKYPELQPAIKDYLFPPEAHHSAQPSLFTRVARALHIGAKT